MKFIKTRIPGVMIVGLDAMADERGFFARSFCAKEFQEQGLKHHVMQSNVSFNAKKGTLRGMHYQIAPHTEAKLVICTRGAVYDVVVDLRPSSPSFRQWLSVELSQGKGDMLYIPEGVAHGFQTLMDDTELGYQMFEMFDPACSRGVRWDDPAFGVKWPEVKERIMSPKDREYPDFVL